MKKRYVKPVLEIETYSLDKSIASHCSIVVSNGPAMGIHTQCTDYVDPFEEEGISAEAVYNVQFYTDGNCDCYYSSSGDGYWTS